ncbi:MAG: prepilin-type N-terminal cleavage/methylation domain-containing protein [Gammaproteobacteria bacterium]
MLASEGLAGSGGARALPKTKGFTLIELAVVLLVIGLLLVGLLGPLRTQVEARDRQRTQERLDEIRESIYGFASAYGRLPCPDTNGDGLENKPGATCTAAQGTLPFVNLGVPGLDAWGRRYVYRVDTAFADDGPGGAAGCPMPAPPTTFNLCDNGGIQILDAAGGGSVANQIPAVIVSHGANKLPGTASAFNDERENDPDAGAVGTDATFVSTDYRNNPADEFDDLVTWISPNILKARMVQAGRLP